MRYKAHIVSHSHWDREWYMHFEQYHMKLIDLVDSVLDKIENCPKFDSFHLDGQMIIIEDYLKVRPQNKSRIEKAIKNGKLKIGPWYVAQDCYLTSSEANVRNLQLGIKEAQSYGVDNYIGYFPDTFGFPLQTVQMYKQVGIDTLVFGRGVNVCKDENINKSQSKYSELILKAPNGEEMLGILLSNWYNNGSEIPTNKDEAKIYWDRKLSDAKGDASTRHLLFMNGSDHQPLQTDIIEAIDTANELYPDIEFVHTSLEKYIEELRLEIDYSKLSILDEEIKQQYTDGMFYLTGTASSRINSKQANFEMQEMLEKQLEPLQIITETFDQQKNDYIWKTLVKNHAHDSICGCSSDEVNSTVMERFRSVKYAAKELLRDSNFVLEELVTGQKNSFALTNQSLFPVKKYIELDVNIDKEEFFDDSIDTVRSNVLSKAAKSYKMLVNGKETEAFIIDMGISNTYELPKNKFRKAMLCRKLKVKFVADIDAGTTAVYTIEPSKDIVNEDKLTHIENEFYRIDLDDTLNLFDKSSAEKLSNFIRFEDCGDIGNTFMICNVENDTPITFDFENSKNKVVKTKDFEQLIVEQDIKLPVGAEEEEIFQERNSFVFNEYRKAQRSSKFIINKIRLIITLVKDNNIIDFKFELDNKSMDHRIRAIFKLPTKFENVTSGTIFEQAKRKAIIKRDIKLSNNQHQFEKALQVGEENLVFTIGTKGLYEYEAISDNEVAITLLRSVGEMGDWLYFKAPDAQCIGKHALDFNFSISAIDNKNQQLQQVYDYYTNLNYFELTKVGEMNLGYKHFESIDNNNLIITSLKSDGKNAIIRGYALDNTKFEYCNKDLILLNLVGDELSETTKEIDIKANEIFTIKIVDFK